jgi:cytochrome c-type biogenesis protein CcsB
MGFFVLYGVIMAGYLGSTWAYIRHFPNKQVRVGRYATGLLIIALICHSVALIIRSVNSGHLPFVGLHESMSFFAWLIAIVYLFLELRFRDKSLGTFVVPMVLAGQIVSMIFIHPEDPLPPLLQSPWFNLHVTVSFLAYAAFFFSFITGLLYVMQMYYIHRRRVGLIFSRLPALGMLDEMNLKATSIGWLFLTIGIATGVWWASDAFDSITPWVKDPKVFCVMLTWVIYSGQLVARYTAGWQGERAAYLALVGFASVLVAYIGAGLWTNVHIF